jgi:hypothetical protein
MLIYGEGGTGKSVVIQTVSQAFATRGRPYLLLKASYTDIAASLIDGKTCHTIAQISISHCAALGPDAKKKLHNMWQHARYLIIDEYSMLSRPFLATLSKNITLATLLNGFGLPDCSFGGINVILCGDLHQFPPVAVKDGDYLFHPIDLRSQDSDSALGRNIYEEFTTVVILREQKQTSDPGWCSFLRRLRSGEVKQNDTRMLRSLIVDRDPTKKVDFNSDPWSSAPLITSRHRVRNLWNKTALRKWCKRSGQQLLVVRLRSFLSVLRSIYISFSFSFRSSRAYVSRAYIIVSDISDYSVFRSAMFGSQFGFFVIIPQNASPSRFSFCSYRC